MIALLLIVLILVCASSRALYIYDEPRRERFPWFELLLAAALLVYWAIGQPGTP